MTCNIIKTNEYTAFVCTRGSSSERCQTCGNKSNLLCDFPLRGEKTGKTCDRKICRGCTKNIDGKDYCPAHAKMINFNP